MNQPDEKFWSRVAAKGPKILALDYDGTLAPFKEDRMAAFPYPGVMPAIETIKNDESTLIAVISGRPLSELDELLGPVSEKIIAVGAHGHEWREPGSKSGGPELPDSVVEALDQAFRNAVEAAGRAGGDSFADNKVERKPASVAVHVRGVERRVADDLVKEVERSWFSLAGEDLDLLNFDGGLELRARGLTKGDALKKLVRSAPGSGLVVYLGDDVTDEDAFKALPETGVGIKVGDPANTSAHYSLPDIPAVLEFLSGWIERTGSNGS